MTNPLPNQQNSNSSNTGGQGAQSFPPLGSNPIPPVGNKSNPFLSQSANDKLKALNSATPGGIVQTNPSRPQPRPINPTQDMSQHLQQNSKVVGSYGNWNDNGANQGQRPNATMAAASTPPQRRPGPINPNQVNMQPQPNNGAPVTSSPLPPRPTQQPPRPPGLTNPNPLPQQQQPLEAQRRPMRPQQGPNPQMIPQNQNSNLTASAQQFVMTRQTVQNQVSRPERSPVPVQQAPSANVIPAQVTATRDGQGNNGGVLPARPINMPVAVAGQPRIAPTVQNPQGRPAQGPVRQPRILTDHDSVEYLRTLSPAELRKEVVKTEVEIQRALIETEKAYREGVTTIRDLIAPSAIKINTASLELNTKLVRSFFVLTYPRVISTGWLEGLVNADIQMDISIFVYPRDSGEVLRDLRGKVGKIQASLRLNSDQGRARDPQLETAYRDVEGLRDAIQQGVEKFFRVGVYVQIYANTVEELEKTSQTIEGVLSQQSIITKRSALQMDDGFNACLPILKDDLDVVTNMNTSPLSACFPFVSSDLSSDSGILYGINRHNSSLIIFDRFELENANSLVFATSGAGKSYAVKLEILRSRMMGVGVIVIDPEQEYKVLADALGGAYVNLSLNSASRINPFDLPKPLPGESTGDIIRSAIIDLMGLMNLMLGKLNPTETSIMEKAINECYAKKDITTNSDLGSITAPTMSDLVEILNGIVGGESLSQRLYRYTEGTFAGIFNKPSNININNDFIVFSIRDLQESLRPIAMYILLNYIWTEIRSSLKKRILAIDEAWILMQYEDSARFLYSLAKRARKYYLGVTTISQDVTDFLASPLGKPIVTNAAMKILLKQSSAAIDQVGDTFALTGGEKQVLMNSDVGQGIFFAGPRHVALEIVAFPTEHKIITSNPKDILGMQAGQ
jgi:conjugal transfer ATP-binding protein TraC